MSSNGSQHRFLSGTLCVVLTTSCVLIGYFASSRVASRNLQRQIPPKSGKSHLPSLKSQKNIQTNGRSISAFISREPTAEEVTSLGLEGGIYSLRIFLRALTPQEAVAWIRNCEHSLRRECAVIALAIEHPEASKPFYETADLGTQQAMLKGWAQSLPSEMLARISTEFNDLNTAKETWLMLPILLRHNHADTIAMLARDSKQSKLNIPLEILREWALMDEQGISAEVRRGVNSSFPIGTLWEAISDEYINRRDPWLWIPLLRGMNEQEAASIVEALHSQGSPNEASSLSQLAVAVEGIDPEVIMAMPNANQNLLSTALLAGDTPATDKIIAAEWNDSQARDFARAAIAYNLDLSVDLLRNAEVSGVLKQSLADEMARLAPEKLIEVNDVLPAIKLAALIKTDRKDLVNQSQALQNSRISEIFPSNESWEAAGLHVEQLAKLALENANAWRDSGPWLKETLSIWIDTDPVMSSSAISQMQSGPSFDIAAVAIIESVLRDGDLNSARSWFQRVSPEIRREIATKHPEINSP